MPLFEKSKNKKNNKPPPTLKKTRTRISAKPPSGLTMDQYSELLAKKIAKLDKKKPKKKLPNIRRKTKLTAAQKALQARGKAKMKKANEQRRKERLDPYMKIRNQENSAVIKPNKSIKNIYTSTSRCTSSC